MSECDDIYAELMPQVENFAFDERVARVFSDMIHRSVPGYAFLLGALERFARRYVRANSHIYDLGCSLGAGTLALRRGVQADGCRIVAVDSASAMTARCRANVAGDNSSVPVEVRCADIRDIVVERASLVAINFTLQFIPPKDRTAVIERIAEGLVDGGRVILSEKVRNTTPHEDEFLQSAHEDFKRAMGYSDLEIAQKRTALENVMQLDSVADHLQRLSQSGLNQHCVWFQCYNFVSIAAWR